MSEFRGITADNCVPPLLLKEPGGTRVQIHDTPRHICEYGVDMDAD
jgi:hypothetical protein